MTAAKRGAENRRDERWSFLGGLAASVPVVVGYLPAAAAFGVAARSTGLSTTETLLMSLLVYSGASQFAVVGLVAAGASWLIMVATALVLGVRHVLYGPSLALRLRRMSTGRATIAAFGLTDEVFAVASTRQPGRLAGFGWLLGLELGAYVSWAFGSWAGASAGAVVVEALPSLAPALSFALPALFVALLVPLVKPGGATSEGASGPLVGAVLVAGVVAVVLQLIGLGSWSVLVAGVAGPAVGLLLGSRDQ